MVNTEDHGGGSGDKTAAAMAAVRSTEPRVPSTEKNSTE
jgi:hypothetical protein